MEIREGMYVRDGGLIGKAESVKRRSEVVQRVEVRWFGGGCAAYVNTTSPDYLRISDLADIGWAIPSRP